MGAAFLLLETKNVVQFALLFGTTWFVNALVFFGILLAVLLAVEVARRVPLPPLPWLYALLARVARGRLAGAAGRRCSRCGPAAVLAPPSRSRSLPSSSRTSSSPSGSATRRFDRRRSAPTCSARCSAACSSTRRCSVGYRNLLFAVAVLYGVAFALRPRDAGAQRTDGARAVPATVA